MKNNKKVIANIENPIKMGEKIESFHIMIYVKLPHHVYRSIFFNIKRIIQQNTEINVKNHILSKARYKVQPPGLKRLEIAYEKLK